MGDLPDAIFSAVKDNPVVQWFMVIVVILTVGTNTATKLKGPVGGLARWFRGIGEGRDAREAEERRKARQRLLQEASEGRKYVESELEDLKTKVDSLLASRSALDGLVETHLGWDYDRKAQLIELGVKPTEIPPAPPLRVPSPATPPKEPDPAG